MLFFYDENPFPRGRSVKLKRPRKASGNSSPHRDELGYGTNYWEKWSLPSLLRSARSAWRGHGLCCFSTLPRTVFLPRHAGYSSPKCNALLCTYFCITIFFSNKQLFSKPLVGIRTVFSIPTFGPRVLTNPEVIRRYPEIDIKIRKRKLLCGRAVEY